jgi:ribonuclease E
MPAGVDGLNAPAVAEGDRDPARRRRRRGGRDRNDGRVEGGPEPVDTGDGADLRTDSAAEAGNAPAEAEARPPREGGEREGGRSRGGRGRGRRDGAENREPAAAEGEPAAETHAAYVEHLAQQAVPAAVAAAVDDDVTANTAPVPAMEPVRSAATVEAPSEPVLAVPAAAVHIEPYVLPTESLITVAQSVGLEWVNSDADKILAVQAAMAAEPKPAHVPRVPRPPVVVEDGPLVLVETKRDLSQLKLPFEQRAG